MYVIPAWRKRWSVLEINERIVEIPFIFKNLPKNTKSAILDVGCCETILPIQLSSLGYQVTGLDIRDYELGHPNFKFVKEDICQTKLSHDQFDVITCVSMVEHVGLNTIYGKSNQKSSDKKAIKSMFSLLKPGGKLFITTPVANTFSQSEFMKIYTPQKIHQLLKDFLIIKEQYFAPDTKRVNWKPCSIKELPPVHNFGVITVIAQKPGKPRK